MSKMSKRCVIALLGSIALAGSAQGGVVNVPVSSSNSAAWARSPNGGTGTSNTGGPGVWNSAFAASIPAGSTSISFTLDSFGVDDKGVVELNGVNIGDAVIFQTNGGAAGAGTFDFGGGNAAYTFVGFTPGASTPLADGTAAFNLIGYVNDTGTSNPSAAPLQVAGPTGFNFFGTLTYDTGPDSVLPIPALSGIGLALLALILAAAAALMLTRSRA